MKSDEVIVVEVKDGYEVPPDRMSDVLDRIEEKVLAGTPIMVEGLTVKRAPKECRECGHVYEERVVLEENGETDA